MKFNPLDIFIDITQGYDYLWSNQKKLCYGLVAIAFVLMSVGVATAGFWPLIFGISVCVGSTAAAYIIGRES